MTRNVENGSSVKEKKGWKKVEDYREVILFNTMYKVYAAVLEDKLGKEMEEKEMLDQSSRI